MIRIKLNSVMVDDQARARDFYTRILGFRIKHDIPMGEFSWLTVTAADDPDGTELLLEPNSGLPEAAVFQKAVYDAGMPVTLFAVDDLDSEYERLKSLDAPLRGEPVRPAQGPALLLLEDRCGNLIQLYQA